MIQFFLPFITAIALSGIAAFYSVVGLAQIFPGSFWPIIFMGSVLEVSKLVTVSWLYNNWKKTNVLMKSYFLVAIILLMAITSMGIFGFLSRSHIEHSVTTGNSELQVQQLQEKIVREKKRITDSEIVLKQLDGSVQSLIDLGRLTGRNGSITLRKSQKEERDSLQETINESMKNIDSLEQEKTTLESANKKIEAEVGPIKYIAELIYDANDTKFIDKAVRIVIFIIIVVFDPLAVLLLIAANQSIRTAKRPKIFDNIGRKRINYTDNNEIIPKSKIHKME